MQDIALRINLGIRRGLRSNSHVLPFGFLQHTPKALRFSWKNYFMLSDEHDKPFCTKTIINNLKKALGDTNNYNQ